MVDKEFRRDIKEALEGKTISEVRFPKVSELVCEIYLDTGESIFLHATDMGAWIGEPDPYYYKQDCDGSWIKTSDNEKDEYFEGRSQ